MDNTELRRIPINAANEYYASSDGWIWRMLKYKPRETKSKLTCYKQHNGTWFKLLRPIKRGKSKNYLAIEIDDVYQQVHRLLLLTFKPIENSELYQCNHIDRNTFNNEIDNLEWCTNQENCLHRNQTILPAPYEVLGKQWEAKLESLIQEKEEPVWQAFGSWTTKYDTEKIVDLLSNTCMPAKDIAACVPCSFDSVNYWRNKLKIKRPKAPSLSQKVEELLSQNNYTAKGLASLLNVQVTSIHAVLRKRKA